MLHTHTERLKLAKISLHGLSVGDALGQRFFLPKEELEKSLTNRLLPPAPWYFTDDTIMAMGIYDVLRTFGEINQDSLAKVFASNYQKDDSRGYGGTAHGILRQINEGKLWREVSANAFNGMGSMGNGAAMRAALIGAYFYDDLEKVVAQARLSAEVTHFHLEGQAGAIAVAVAAALATHSRINSTELSANQFIEAICIQVPESETLSRTRRGLHLSPHTNIQTIVNVLGNGSDLTAQQTVPFTIWAAAHHLKNYEEAIWTAINGLGDRDTTSATVGSIVALSAGLESVPELWRDSTESIYNTSFLNLI